MVSDEAVDESPVALQRSQRALFVFRHPRGIAHRIGGEALRDRGRANHLGVERTGVGGAGGDHARVGEVVRDAVEHPRHVLVARPVELLAAVPNFAIRTFDLLDGLAEDCGHAREPDLFVGVREVGRVGDQCFPEVEGDGSKHSCRLSVLSCQTTDN